MPAPGDVTVIYILNGSCKYISQFACKIGLSLFLPCITHSVWSLLLSFGYRYYILHYSALTRLKLVKIVLLILIPSLFQGVSFKLNCLSFVNFVVLLRSFKKKLEENKVTDAELNKEMKVKERVTLMC